MALWALTTFAILGVGIARITSSQLRVVGRLEERLTSQFLAQAAVRHALTLRHADKTPYDTLQELRAVQHRVLGRGEFSYTLLDEESRIPLNTAPQDILARVPGIGAEQAIGITTSTLRPFRLKEELRVVEGLTEETYQQCRDWLTVYGSGHVNINTASAGALKALGLDESLVERITAFRAGADGQEGTDDDGVFERPDAVVSALRASTTLLMAQEAALMQLISQGWLDVRSTAFTVQVETTVLGKAGSTYAIVIDTTQKDKPVKQWSER